MNPVYQNGLVSIIIPTYQRFEDVQEAINSALKQTFVPIEVIVVNDCSSDQRYSKLSEIYKNYEDKVHVVDMPKNSKEISGTSSAQGLTKNLGLEMARGEWVAFLDDDDVYIDDNKLKLQIDEMVKNSCLMSSTNMVTGVPPYRYRYVSEPTLYFDSFKYGVDLGNQAYRLSGDLILHVNLINNSTVVLHRSIVEQVGLFKACKYEDWDYWIRAMMHTDCIYLNIPTVYYSTGSVKKYC